jgi:Uncharacterized protein conserved in bacteria
VKHLLFIILFQFAVNLAWAQEDCKVLLDSLKGTYTGECKSGKANGAGKAVGFNSYEGQFVDGYPEGKGMYIWKDGHYYIGEFKKGKLNGAGEMYYESASGDDSTITGYWEKNKYKGLYEKPFVIHKSSTNILKIDCKQLSKKAESITIESHRQSTVGTTYRSGGGNQVLPYVREIKLITGTYGDIQGMNTYNSTTSLLLQAVFPFRAIIYYNTGDFFEISLFEKGEYEVMVDCL